MNNHYYMSQMKNVHELLRLVSRSLLESLSFVSEVTEFNSILSKSWTKRSQDFISRFVKTYTGILLVLLLTS